jgi:hypothetical protein
MSLNLQKIAVEIGLTLRDRIQFLDATHFEEKHTQELKFRIGNMRPSQAEIQALIDSSVKLQSLERVADICMRELQLPITHKNYIKRVKKRDRVGMDNRDPKYQNKRPKDGEVADYTEAVFNTAYLLMSYTKSEIELTQEREDELRERLRSSAKASSAQMKVLVTVRHRLGLMVRCTQAAIDMCIECYGKPITKKKPW